MATIWAAAEAGDVAKVESYLSGILPDPNVRDEYGATPIFWAAGSGHIQVIEALLGAGADINMHSSRGDIALHWAATRGQTETVAYLIERNSEVDIANGHGYTPLHLACHKKFASIAYLLVLAGASVERTTPRGETAMGLSSVDVREEIRKAQRIRSQEGPQASYSTSHSLPISIREEVRMTSGASSVPSSTMTYGQSSAPYVPQIRPSPSLQTSSPRPPPANRSILPSPRKTTASAPEPLLRRVQGDEYASVSSTQSNVDSAVVQSDFTSELKVQRDQREQPAGQTNHVASPVSYTSIGRNIFDSPAPSGSSTSSAVGRLSVSRVNDLSALQKRSPAVSSSTQLQPKLIQTATATTAPSTTTSTSHPPVQLSHSHPTHSLPVRPKSPERPSPKPEIPVAETGEIRAMMNSWNRKVITRDGMVQTEGNSEDISAKIASINATEFLKRELESEKSRRINSEAETLRLLEEVKTLKARIDALQMQSQSPRKVEISSPTVSSTPGSRPSQQPTKALHISQPTTPQSPSKAVSIRLDKEKSSPERLQHSAVNVRKSGVANDDIANLAAELHAAISRPRRKTQRPELRGFDRNQPFTPPSRTDGTFDAMFGSPLDRDKPSMFSLSRSGLDSDSPQPRQVASTLSTQDNVTELSTVTPRMKNEVAVQAGVRTEYDSNAADDDVIEFLGGLQLNEYIPLFAAQGIDGRALRSGLTNEDLVSIGMVRLGHRKKLLEALAAKYPSLRRFSVVKPIEFLQSPPSSQRIGDAASPTLIDDSLSQGSHESHEETELREVAERIQSDSDGDATEDELYTEQSEAMLDDSVQQLEDTTQLNDSDPSFEEPAVPMDRATALRMHLASLENTPAIRRRASSPIVHTVEVQDSVYLPAMHRTSTFVDDTRRTSR